MYSFYKGSVLFCLWLHPGAFATQEIDKDQQDYESSIQSIVRNKHFYKPGRFEAGVFAGLMPYDSLISHYMAGGRLTWHLSDHYGWEVADLMAVFPSVTRYTKDLVKDKSISNLQTLQLRFLASSNFLLSPFYGKIRFFGRQLLYLDLYLVGGLGVAKSEALKVSTTAQGVEPTDSLVRQSWDPLVTLGFGFKIFLNDATAVLFDLRDYLVITKLYGNSTTKSNFSVFGGLSLFLPVF